tara:strand:- start:977 stop:1354 length:378 start_codon:yes stop_codon:yes gene_type:complete
MEATMHQPIKKNAPDNNNTNGGIADLIKYTPSLEQYIVANILTKCGKAEGYEGKYRFSLYKGWINGNQQYGRVCFYHKRFCKKNQTKVVCITSYFLRIGIREIGIHLPNNKGKTPDITIDFPTKG